MSARFRAYLRVISPMVRSWLAETIPLGIPIRIMNHSVARPSPPLPPVAPTPSPCVYTPHHLKYADAHSGATLDRPARANARTSSKASHGFFSRFSRSIRWALVSFGAGASLIFSLLFRSAQMKCPRELLAQSRASGKPWTFVRKFRPRSPLPREQHTRATTGHSFHGQNIRLIWSDLQSRSLLKEVNGRTYAPAATVFSSSRISYAAAPLPSRTPPKVPSKSPASDRWRWRRGQPRVFRPAYRTRPADPSRQCRAPSA